MSDNLSDASRAIYEILLNIRGSIDRHSEFTNVGHLRENAKKRMYLRVESAKYSFNRPTSSLVTGTKAERIYLLDDLTRELKELIGDRESDFLKEAKFRLRTSGQKPTNLVSKFDQRFIFADLSVYAAVEIFLERISELRYMVSEQRDMFEFDIDIVTELNRIIPDQKIAPLKFSFVNGVLVLDPQTSKLNPEDNANVSAAKDDIIKRGDRVIDELQRSNCDRRLVDSVLNLQESILSGINIIQSGIANIECVLMLDAFRDELPDSVSMMLQAHTISVNMYIGQFPDWARFVEKAAAVEIDNSDIASVANASRRAVDSLLANSEIVAPEVPASLKRLSDLISNPANASKRAAFAVLRSLENLIIKIFSYGADFLDQTAKKSISSLATVTSAALVAGLLTLAVSSATELGPLAAKVKELKWMKSAADVIDKQIKQLAK